MTAKFAYLTLRQLVEKHPEWLDLPIGVYNGDGNKYIGKDDVALYDPREGLSEDELKEFIPDNNEPDLAIFNID